MQGMCRACDVKEAWIEDFEVVACLEHVACTVSDENLEVVEIKNWPQLAQGVVDQAGNGPPVDFLHLNNVDQIGLVVFLTVHLTYVHIDDLMAHLILCLIHTDPQRLG